MFLPTQAAARQAGVQAKRFGVGEEVEGSGQRAGAGLALSCTERRVSISLVAALLLEAYALLPARHHVLFGLNQLAAQTVRVWKQACGSGTKQICVQMENL